MDRRLTRRQITEIQKTVALLPNDNRKELAKTICEIPRRKTSKGDLKTAACLKMREQLEQHGLLTLPARKQAMVRPDSSKPVWTAAFGPPSPAA